MSVEPRYRVLAILPGVIPSSAITVIKPLLGLERLGVIRARIRLEWLVRTNDLEWADLFIFCRNCEPGFSSAFRWALERGKPIIYDIDDNFFDLPDNTEDFDYYNTPERQAMLVDYIKNASLVRVYSRRMFDQISALTSHGVRVPAPFDLDLIKIPAQVQTNPIKIVYATSRKMDPLFPIFWPALQSILNDYPGLVEAHFWGFFAKWMGHLPGIHFHTPTANYDDFMRKFSRAGFSIGLAPLLDTNFYRSKTNNKFREYGGCKIAGIYSNVEVYSDCVVDEETGLLVENTEDAWYRALSRLITDETLRTHIQTQAQLVVRSQYSETAFEQTWLEHIKIEIQSLPGKVTPVDFHAFQQTVSGANNSYKIGSSQVQKAISVLRNDGISSVIERAIYKLEQTILLARISLKRRF